MSLPDYLWEQIGWEGFEKMCLYLAECVWPDRRFELYGRAGEEQEGIDIISKNEKGETVICIQCKRYKKLGVSDLRKIIKKFEEGEFGKTANSFIIATRASLNTAKHLGIINLERKRFKNDLQKEFEPWDVNYIEKELSKNYTLASKYFGVEVAEMIWAGKAVMPLGYDPVDDYIKRNIIQYRIESTSDKPKWLSGSRELLELSCLFTRDFYEVKRYCLLADPYQGKTTLLKQLAYELFYHDLKLKPVFLQLKDHPHRSLIDTLNNSYSWWRDVPIKELVIIVDGLDEVDAGWIREAVKYINEFSQRFPSLAIIFSCRKLIFHRNELQEILKEFAYYELYPLQDSQVATYLTRSLAEQERLFRKHIERFDLNQFLYHPFYLCSLVGIFKRDRQKLPRSRVATIEYFLKESFDVQAFRELKGGSVLKRKQALYLKLLKKAAFAMQLRGQNILSDDEVQQLFPDDTEIELLQFGSILTFSQEKWSFQNAIFQEYLSALVLKNFSFSRIEKIICVGREIKKVRTKWIQTLVVLISILPPGGIMVSSLFDLLRNDNIELLVLCDNQMLALQDRLNILHQLLQRYQQRKLRPIVVYEDNIGHFFYNQVEAIDMMLDFIAQTAETEVKQILWRILRFVGLPMSYQNQVLALAEKEIKYAVNGLYVNDILYTIGHCQMGRQEFVEFLISKPELSRQLSYRDGVYEMIVQLNLGENFYDYGLDGIKFIMTTPARSISRSTRFLERMLLSAATVKSMTKLFDIICSEERIDFIHHSYSGDEPFMQRLAKLCKKIYEEDVLMVLSVLHFIQCLGRKHLWNDMKEIDRFFFESGTTSFAIRYLIHQPFPYIEWELGKILTEESFDFLLNCYEDGYIKLVTLREILSSVHIAGSKEVGEAFNKLYVAATGAEDVLQISLKERRTQEAYEQKKRLNDLFFIQNEGSFSKGLKNYFKAHGKESLSEEDILLEYDDVRTIWRDTDSNVLSSFIIYQFHNKKPVKLS